jgi:hypothetical protein
MIVDNLARRGYDAQLGMDTLTPIASIHERVKTWQEVSGKTLKLEIGDICDWEFLSQVRPCSRRDRHKHNLCIFSPPALRMRSMHAPPRAPRLHDTREKITPAHRVGTAIWLPASERDQVYLLRRRRNVCCLCC